MSIKITDSFQIFRGFYIIKNQIQSTTKVTSENHLIARLTMIMASIPWLGTLGREKRKEEKKMFRQKNRCIRDLSQSFF